MIREVCGSTGLWNTGVLCSLGSHDGFTVMLASDDFPAET